VRRNFWPRNAGAKKEVAQLRWRRTLVVQQQENAFHWNSEASMTFKEVAIHHTSISAADIIVHDRCVENHTPGLRLPCFQCSSVKRTACLRVITARKLHAARLQKEAVPA
jgi:hypothetical protein